MVFNVEEGVKDEATVKFLQKSSSRLQNNRLFRWPETEDIANVSANFVFRWNFEVEPLTENARFWVVEDLQSIEESYIRLKGDPALLV